MVVAIEEGDVVLVAGPSDVTGRVAETKINKVKRTRERRRRRVCMRVWCKREGKLCSVCDCWEKRHLALPKRVTFTAILLTVCHTLGNFRVTHMYLMYVITLCTTLCLPYLHIIPGTCPLT